MKKLYCIITLAFGFLSSFAQKDCEEISRRNNYSIRLLEEKIRSLEGNHRFQMENLQAQLLVLSAKDTTHQKQLLSTLQLYLEQADKKYAQELAELKKQKDERKSEVNSMIQNHTVTLQNQINQQASMLYYVGLGIIALCIMLFLVALKFIKDQQERYLSDFAYRQQNDLRAIINTALQENLNREIQKYFHQNPITATPNPNQVQEIVDLMQNKLSTLEEKIAQELSKQNSVSPETTASQVETTRSENIAEEEVVTISEAKHSPNEVVVPFTEKEEEYTPQEEELEEQTIFTPEQEVENEEVMQEHILSNNREWVEEIEQKINQSLQSNQLEEEIEEQVIYAKDSKELFETNIYTPEYEELLKVAAGHYEQKNYDLAIECLSKALAIMPDYSVYTRRANCYHILKKYDQAAEDYEKAIRLKKDFIPAYNNAIEIYILTDNFFQALTLLERLSQIEKPFGYKAVELYLKLIAQKGLMQNTEKTERELDALLRENFTFNFSVREIEDWLITADIDTTDKKMIRVKTELLKMKKEYAGVA
jgi:tetratricopeptide (TPR) repeat protein